VSYSDQESMADEFDEEKDTNQRPVNDEVESVSSFVIQRIN